MYIGTIYNIMVGSPSDVSFIADIAVNCIHRWNTLNSNDKHIALVPHHWTSSSYPSLKDSAQKVINNQMVQYSDALIAVFGSRIGTPTKDNISGTVEEIQEHLNAGKHVMVFFCDKLDANADMEQIKQLQTFRSTIEGLYEMYSDAADFQHKFTEKLSLFVQKELINQVEVAVTEIKQPEVIQFSEKEQDIIRKWCRATSNYLSKNNFIGGHSLFSFSGMSYETQNIKETAEMDDFIDRMLREGIIIPDGANKQGNIKYKLSFKGLKQFS